MDVTTNHTHLFKVRNRRSYSYEDVKEINYEALKLWVMLQMCFQISTQVNYPRLHECLKMGVSKART